MPSPAIVSDVSVDISALSITETAEPRTDDALSQTKKEAARPVKIPLYVSQVSSVAASTSKESVKPKSTGFDVSKVALYVSDLEYLLSSDFPLERIKNGMKVFYEIFRPEVKLMNRHPAFAKEQTVGILFKALLCKHNCDSSWVADVFALIRIFARPEKNCDLIGNPDNLRPLLKLMAEHVSDPLVQQHGLAIMFNMAHIGVLVDNLRTAGGMDRCSAVIGTYPKDIELQRLAVQVLERIICSVPSEPGNRAAQSVVASMTTYPRDVSIQSSGCGALFLYSSTGTISFANKDFVSAHGGLAVLLKALRAFESDPKIVAKAMKALDSICLAATPQIVLKRSDGLQLVKELLFRFKNAVDIRVPAEDLLERMGALAEPPVTVSKKQS